MQQKHKLVGQDNRTLLRQPRVFVLVFVHPLLLRLSQVAGPIMLLGFMAPSAWQHSLSGQ